MKIEEYIAKRKKEDGLNEFDYESRMENLKICINYTLEYFNNYLSTLPADEKTVLQDMKNEKYRSTLLKKGYSYEIANWFVSLYADYGNHIERIITSMTRDVKFFLLYTTNAEFRALSYDIYSKVTKRFPYLDGQSEMIYKSLKEIHAVRNRGLYNKHYITDEIEDWIKDTYNDFGVNMYQFCEEWVSYFYDKPDIWPKNCKHRSKEYYEAKGEYYLGKNDSFYWDYDYKQGKNLFCIDSLYRELPKKSFIRGKKQFLEATMLYSWIYCVTGEGKDYWEEYCKLVFNN